jgi:hypothetical protein
METKNAESTRIAICPIFNFELSDTLDNGFLFSNNILLRKITKEEIDLFQDPHKTHPIMWFDGAHLIYSINDRTLVYEVKDIVDRSNQDSNDRPNSFFSKASRLIYEVQLAMRLQNYNSVFWKIYIIRDDSKILGLGSIYSPAPYKPNNSILNFNEIAEIDSLVRRINKLDLENNSPFRIAFERFSRSHEERRKDDRIVDLTIGFGSLFANYKVSRLEYMGKFIGLGCSMLLGKDNDDRKFIAAFLEKAFEIRNKVVHGETVPNPIEVTTKKRVKRHQIYLR